MEEELETQEKYRSYVPIELPKHHCNTKNKQDEEYGRLVEILKSKRLFLILKSILTFAIAILGYILIPMEINEPQNFMEQYGKYIVLLIVGGYGIYLLIRAFSTVYLYQKGFILQRLFKKDRYSYHEINGIRFVKKLDSNSPARVRMSYILRKIYSYWICQISIKNKKAIELKGKTYKYLKEKMENVAQSLVYSTEKELEHL